MFRFRLHRSDRDVLLAVTDEELIGARVQADKVVIHITEQFYGTDTADEAELRDLLTRCTVANLMGPRCIALAAELGYVGKTNVRQLGPVPHAQVARML